MRPFSAPIAPEQPQSLVDQAGASSKVGPQDVQQRQAVEPVVGRLPGRTVSAGEEIASIPFVFDLPNTLRNIYGRLTTGHRTTMLAPELQSELDAVNANVMPSRGMATPYVVREPGPWYESFLSTIGPS